MGTFIIPNIIKIKRGGTLKTKKKGGKLIIIIIFEHVIEYL